MLALLALLTIAFAGVGAWRGWYNVGDLSASTGRVSFRVEIHPLKVGSDVLTLFRSGGKDENKTAESPPVTE
jgi:hypothetical protein